MTFPLISYGGPSFKPVFADGMFRYRIHAPVLRPGGSNGLPPLKPNAPVSTDPKRFSVSGNYDEFCQIVADMQANAGEFEPIGHWHIRNAGSNTADVSDVAHTSKEIVYSIDSDEFTAKYGTLELMLDPLVGRDGMQQASEAAVESFERYLRAIDWIGLVEPDLLAQARRNHWLLTDLGSLMDANLALGFGLFPPSVKPRILEIGGGYGRLAEVVVNLLDGKCHYVMADSVPATLMFAYIYLKRALPDHAIGSYFNGDKYHGEWTVYIAPTWRLKETIKPKTFDVAVNIESFQEMSARHVHLYLDQFCSAVTDSSLLYLSNSWRYLYKGSFDIPSDFQTLYLQNTPRSWTMVHPTHVLRKGGEDYSTVNAAMLEFFRATCS
jgi:hypothetical protein